MRISLDLPATDRAAFASAADAAGLFGVALRSGSGAETVRAAEVALATTDARIMVEVVLGDENPVTLAEELAVLDNVTAGRLVAILHTGSLTADEALEDIGLVSALLTSRPVRHIGARWRVPAGVNDGVPDSLMLSPQPTQVAVPLWLDGDAAQRVGRELGIPVLATSLDDPMLTAGVQPGAVAFTGDLATDRDLVTAWAAAGVTHLVAAMPADSTPEHLRDYIARYLMPEVSMVGFPRLLAEATVPPAWPGAR